MCKIAILSCRSKVAKVKRCNLILIRFLIIINLKTKLAVVKKIESTIDELKPQLIAERSNFLDFVPTSS